MESKASFSTKHRRTPIRRDFSISSLISFYIYDGITTMGESESECYDFWQFFYLKEGRATYTTEDGKEYEVTAGQIILRPPFHASKVDYHTDSHNVICIVSFECDSIAMDRFIRPPETLYGEEAALLMQTVSTGIRIFEMEYSRENTLVGLRVKADAPASMLNYCASAMEHFLNMLYCRFTQANYYHDETGKINQRIYETRLISQVKQYLAEHMASSPSIDEIAAAFRVSPITLMKLFKEETGCSIIQYLTRLKLDKAMRLISKTSMNFTEIAHELGFSSLNYFSRVFKSHVGLTLTEFARTQSKQRNL